MELARLEWHLENWVDYMRKPAHKLGYPSKSLCIASGTGSGLGVAHDAFDILCEEADTDSAIKMDAMIDSLQPNQRAAIHHKWLNAVYRLRDMENSYLDALENLMLLADRRGLV